MAKNKTTWNRLTGHGLTRSGFTRRGLLRSTAALAAIEAAGGVESQASAAPLEVGSNLYPSIGVTPVVNCRGTFTIISGSQTLPRGEARHGTGLAFLRSHG